MWADDVADAGDGGTDECALSVDDCDLAAICTDLDEGYACDCPEGYTDTYDDGTECVPILLGLEPSVGALSPDFAGTTTSYAVRLGVVPSFMAFTPSAALGVTIRLDGAVVASGERTTVAVLPLGSVVFTLEVSANGRARSTPSTSRALRTCRCTSRVEPGSA